MRVDYHAIGGAIVKHLITDLPNYCHITDSIDAALGIRKERVSILVLFNGFTHQETHSLSPNTPSRDAKFTLGIIARGDSSDKQNITIDNIISLAEEACNCAEPGSGKGHRFPPYGRIEIERSIAMSASPKIKDAELGLTSTIEVVTRIIESD